MKKIFNLLLTAIVCLGALASCTQDYVAGPMARNITVSPDNQKVAASGETFDVAVTADGAWAASAPEWISVEPAKGEGNATVKVTVAPNEGTARTENVGFYSAVGDVSSTSVDLESTPLATVAVNQAAGGGSSSGDAEAITIAELLAKGENTDSYLITGTITRVVNTTYGNFDLTDDTGTMYVYGLLNEDLEEKVCFADKGLAMGDVLTIVSNEFVNYNGTWEIKNAVYVNHSKSVIALDSDYVYIEKEGDDFDIVATVKGTNVNADFTADWITYNGATKDGDNVTLSFSVAENAGVPRTETIKVSTTTAAGETTAVDFKVEQDGSIPTKTVAEVLAAADDLTSFYRVTGYISKVNNLEKGRFDITDATGTIYAYNTRVAKESDASTNVTTLGIGEGDVVTLIGYKTSYNGTLEIVGYVESFYKVEALSVADFLAKEVASDSWYRLTGTVKNLTNTTYGNFDLSDESGSVYVYGVATCLGGESKKFDTLGVEENDIITIVGKRAAYNGTAQVGNAWYVSHEKGAAPEPEITNKTVAELLAAPDDKTVNYRVTGYISRVNNLEKGRFDITDATGTIYAYNTRVAQESSASIDVKTLGIAEGDVVTIVGYKTSYNSTLEVVGYVESFYKVEALSVADFLAKEVSSDSWYRLTGTVKNLKNTTYGNFDLSDESGSVYVYGLLTGLGGASKQFSTLGVEEGDALTIVGKRAAYNGTAQVGNAWYVSHEKGTDPTPEPEPENPDATGFTLTADKLPTAYPKEAATFTQDAYQFNILYVANYGKGIQFKKQAGAFISNKTAMPSEIKSITLTNRAGETAYFGSLKVYAGAAENPEGDAIEGTVSEDGGTMTVTVPSGCKYFKVTNGDKTVYLDNVRIGF